MTSRSDDRIATPGLPEALSVDRPLCRVGFASLAPRAVQQIPSTSAVGAPTARLAEAARTRDMIANAVVMGLATSATLRCVDIAHYEAARAARSTLSIYDALPPHVLAPWRLHSVDHTRRLLYRCLASGAEPIDCMIAGRIEGNEPMGMLVALALVSLRQRMPYAMTTCPWHDDGVVVGATIMGECAMPAVPTIGVVTPRLRRGSGAQPRPLLGMASLDGERFTPVMALYAACPRHGPVGGAFHPGIAHIFHESRPY